MHLQRNDGVFGFAICLIGVEGGEKPARNSSSLGLKWQNTSLSYHLWPSEYPAHCRPGSEGSAAGAFWAYGTSRHASVQLWDGHLQAWASVSVLFCLKPFSKSMEEHSAMITAVGPQVRGKLTFPSATSPKREDCGWLCSHSFPSKLNAQVPLQRAPSEGPSWELAPPIQQLPCLSHSPRFSSAS